MKRKAMKGRGYARNSREEAILVDSGLEPAHIYVEGRQAETLDRITLREGELLITVGGLRPLGDSQRDMIAQASRIHAAGAAVLDVLNGWRSDRQGAEMLDSALRRLRGEVVMPNGKAREMQALSVRARIGDRMPEREALKYWRDPKLTTGEALKHMVGWSAGTAYRRLGNRHLPAGRMAK